MFKEIKLILKNTTWLILGEGISRFLLLFVFIYAARNLTAEGFGIFNFALAIASIFLVFSNLGISDTTTRELAKDQNKVKDYPAVLLLKIILSIIAFILIIIFSFIATSDPYTRKIIWIIGIYVLCHNYLMTVYSFFRARHQMKYETLIKVLEAIFITGFSSYLIFIHPSPENLSFGFSLGSLLAVIIILIYFSIIIKSVFSSWHLNIWKDTLKISWPLGLAYATSLVYIHIDSVMMGFWGQIIEVGWYNAAYKLVGILITASSLLGASFLPLLSKAYLDKKEFKRRFLSYIKLAVFLALISVILGLSLAPYIINVLFGSEFSKGVLAFQILVLMAGLNFIYYPFYLALIASNNQNKIFFISFVGALINIVFNILLIPSYSLYGAAIATLITYIVLVILAIYYSKPVLLK
jgi:O-antigen/teichoic acid export membrane protein